MAIRSELEEIDRQPPSGGCVLKQDSSCRRLQRREAATFGWLCVETSSQNLSNSLNIAATFGWLCVETLFYLRKQELAYCSHLRVAVC